MTDRFFDFMVAPTGSAPRTLTECIRQVGNASAGFCRSWLAHDISDAEATSEEAFELLDHIQNELLRHRDKQSKLTNWQTSPLNAALNVTIGQLLEPASANDKLTFLSQPLGSGIFPSPSLAVPLTLVMALNKLKHRDTNDVNFTVTNTHTLFIFTNAGMNKPDSISSFDVQGFCNFCKLAAQAI
jgi:hypothetical protein